MNRVQLALVALLATGAFLTVSCGEPSPSSPAKPSITPVQTLATSPAAISTIAPTFTPTPILTPTPTPIPTPLATPTSTPLVVPSPKPVPKVSVEEVKQKLESNASFILVDVRTKAEYDMSHISKAISIPMEELPGRYIEIAYDAKVVVYAGCA